MQLQLSNKTLYFIEPVRSIQYTAQACTPEVLLIQNPTAYHPKLQQQKVVYTCAAPVFSPEAAITRLLVWTAANSWINQNLSDKICFPKSCTSTTPLILVISFQDFFAGVRLTCRTIKFSNQSHPRVMDHPCEIISISLFGLVSSSGL
jgi:hypothetical protein